MFVDASKELELLVDRRQVLNRSEGCDCEFKCSGKLKIGHVSFDEIDSVPHAIRQCLHLRTAARKHMLGLIESSHSAPSLRTGNEHAASTAAELQRLASASTQIDIEVYVTSGIVQGYVVVQLWNFRVRIVAGL